jgi:hypothetical protein
MATLTERIGNMFYVYTETYVREEAELVWKRIGPEFSTEVAANNFIARHPNQDREYMVSDMRVDYMAA